VISKKLPLYILFQQHKMKLKVACQLDYDSKENAPLILMLRPQNGSEQKLIEENYLLTPNIPITEYQDFYGNLCQRMIAPLGKLNIKTSSIFEVKGEFDTNFEAAFVSVENLPNEAIIYTLPSRYCESDKLSNLAFEITQNLPLGYPQVEAIRKWVKNNLTYEYGRSSSSTSAFDVSISRTGVCRDFTHLCLALCRALNIPARMVVGYLYDLKPMDLHAWFEAFVGDKWYTFDATQEHPKGGRVVIAHGRDANDVAFASQFGEMELMNMWVSVEEIR
jgi:transglutaminase-like putative cysteine protease